MGLGPVLRRRLHSLYTSTDTEVAAILTDTGTTLQAELDAIQAGVITNAAGADVATDVVALKAVADAILVDTGTTLDTIVDNLALYAAPAVAAGTTDVDISEADYTGYVTLLTVTAPAAGLSDLVIDLDFDKATTGVNEIATNADTLDCQLQVSPDGTNFVSVESISQITLTGTAGSIADGVNGHRFKVGALYAAGVAKVLIKLSAERDDAEVPYRVTYRGLAAPTVTAVAAA